MSSTQQLGGTRQSSPLEDENSYPLTKDEYLILEDNFTTDKFTNWESFLLTTGLTSIVSLTIIWITGSFEKHEIIGGIEKVEINITQVVIVMLYSAISLGSIIGFIIAKRSKKDSEKPIHRLNEKIMNHLNKTSHE